MAADREPLDGADVAWLRMEQPTNLMMIAGVLIFDDPLQIDTLKEILAERMLIYDRFRQRVRNRRGTPYWEFDPHFDIDLHVHRTALPGAGGKPELQELSSDLMSTPLDFSKPLWQMHLVENYNGGSVVIVRMHHCIGDGIALIHVMISLADEYFDPSRVPSLAEDDGRGGRISRLLRPITKAVTSTLDTAEAIVDEGVSLLNPRHLLKRAKQGMSIGAATSRLLLLPPDSDTVFRGPLSANKRAAWSAPIPLPTIKAIGHRVDAKINDVLVSVATGALRRYLQAHDAPGEDVHIRAVIPVNLRPLEKAHELGNRFGLVFLTLPIGIAEPQARLMEVKRRMDRIKGSSEAGVIFGLLQVAGSGPEEVQEQLVDMLGAKASAVLTNVPGPQEELHIAGSTLTNVMFWVPRAGTVSLGLSILSYNRQVQFGVATDAALVDDPDTIVQAFEDEFEALKRQFLSGKAS
ncbi:MAG: wax ester/triacylglycerol synthase family O-acyltransferase [Bacteroidetes bacterium]|jgi:WS/DGAT/MGAT family acyltransferase|nr:wax ester/triacylglycerol synthase family O-acyltransferase [Bacteroidota bacterium]